MRTGRRLAVLGFAALLAIGWWGCGKKDTTTTTTTTTPTPTPAGGKGALTFEDEGASWITLSNYFATKANATTPYWLGVLFQFGRFKDNEFKGVVKFFDRDGNPIGGDPFTNGSIDSTRFTWINIVTDRAGFSDPLKPKDALNLFPNSKPQSCGSSGDCVRDRRLHWDQRYVPFIITYWQGENGFKVDSRQITPAEPEHKASNSVTFEFPDDFRVTIYKLNEPEDMALVRSFSLGEVKTIKVENTAEGTQPHGGKHDPPWIQ